MSFQCTKFYNELSFLKDIFFKNGYPASFIDKCFKTFLNKIYLKGRQVLTLEKEHLTLALPFLPELSLQTRIKLDKALKRVLIVLKLTSFLKAKEIS